MSQLIIHAGDFAFQARFEEQLALKTCAAFGKTMLRFVNAQGFGGGDQFFTYLKESSDVLYAEGEISPKMMSVGLHCRVVGRPGRAASLMRFLDYIGGHERVRVPTRLQIAQHWRANLTHLAASASGIG
jgi:hypothetical protein